MQVNMTVTTDDEAIRRVFEPFCPSNPSRLAAIKEAQAAGAAACIRACHYIILAHSAKARIRQIAKYDAAFFA